MTLQTPRLSRAAIILTALALSALPLWAFWDYSNRILHGQTLTLPVTLERSKAHGLLPALKVTSQLSQLSLDDLGGERGFAAGDPIAVYLKRSGAVWYPFAVFRSAAPRGTGKASDADELFVRGTVVRKEGRRIEVSYSFDRISPQSAFAREALAQMGRDISLELSVDADGLTSLRAATLDGQRYDQRVMTKDVLFGGKKNTDKIAPPTNPPR